MKHTLRKVSIYAVSAAFSLTFFATSLSAAPRIPRDGGDPWMWVRFAGRLLRRAFDTITVPNG